MAIPKELSHILRFDPGWFTDPVPWLLEHLDKAQLLQVARIKVELQKAVQAAYGKALDQYENVLKGAGR